MGLIGRLFGASDRKSGAALYDAVVARGRAPHWYIEGAVADTVDGRFDMIAAILCMVLLAIEAKDRESRLGVDITERFVDDMDGQLREIGIGDIVVGKHIGKMMGMLGGRLGAYRDALAMGDLSPALVRNLYRGEAPDAAALAHVAGGLARFRAALDELPLARIEQGELPE
ncbi:MAG: ubiquinol-cytochrome C chaperone [Sphingomonas sp.]|nr:ubiquinol-cytochrome C chaperone [Sphingomonas sp.]